MGKLRGCGGLVDDAGGGGGRLSAFFFNMDGNGIDDAVDLDRVDAWRALMEEEDGWLVIGLSSPTSS